MKLMSKLFSAALMLLSFFTAAAQGGPQLYNMGFDVWSKSGGVWHLYEKGAPASRRVWDSPNPGTAKLGANLATPEYEHVAVPGPGKAAARLESRKVAWAFVGGNLFNGRYVRAVELAGVETELGTPFNGRPKRLKGYYHYIPKRISTSKASDGSMVGKMDEGLIEVLLMDWSKPYTQISHKTGFIDPATDPHVIGRAYLVIRKGTSGYVPFDIPFEYRSNKTPSYASFTVTASRFGDTQTGGAGSVLYIDEFSFVY